MTRDRELMQLIAIGRITPAEAERLLAVWNEGREAFLVMLGCFLIVLLASPHASLSWMLDIARSSLPRLTGGFDHVLSTVMRLRGGVL
ncbi:MAG: hypothetical protein ACLQG3_09895 [Terracidiphilus sp.]